MTEVDSSRPRSAGEELAEPNRLIRLGEPEDGMFLAPGAPEMSLTDDLPASDQDAATELLSAPVGEAVFSPSAYALLSPEALGNLEPVTSPSEARVIADHLRDSYAGLVVNQLEVLREAARAYLRRIWIPLGYASWHEMCVEEYSDMRLWTGIEQRQERVQYLLNYGLSTRAISAVLAVGQRTVVRDTQVLSESNDSLNNTPVRGHDGKAYDRVRSMPVEVLDKRIQVIALTDQKVPQEEIAQRLGISQGRVSQLKAEFRESMANLPDEDQEKVVELFETGQTPTVEVVAEALGVTLAGPTSVEESALRSIVALVDEVRQAVKALHDHGIYGAYGDQMQSDLALNRDVTLAVSLKLTTAIAVLARCARALRVDRTGVENIIATLTESSNAIQVLDGWHEQVQAHTSRGK